MQEHSTLPEYQSLIRAKNLQLDADLTLELREFGTNTSGTYNIMNAGEKVGWISLSYHPKNKTCSFDIAVTTPGTGVGTKTVKQVAAKLSEYGYSLFTSGVMPEAADYWKKLVARGIVEEVKSDEAEKQYRVLS